MTPALRRTALRTALPLLATTALLVPAGPVQGQDVSVDVGVDLVSSYLWRGFQYDARPHLQPSLSITVGRWTLGTWGSYGFAGNEKEQDLWLSVAGDLPAGSFALTLFDYYFTDDFRDWTAWRGVKDGEATGAHTLELMAEYFGPETLPIRLLVATTVYNDPDPSVYAEVGYTHAALGLGWEATAGALVQDGGYYGLGRGGWTNLAIGVSRSLATLAGRPIVAGARVVHHPELRDTYLGFTLSF